MSLWLSYVVGLLMSHLLLMGSSHSVLQMQCPGSRAREDAVWLVSSEFKDL